MTTNNNLHFINAPCHQSSRSQGFQFAPKEIKEKYDFDIDPEFFNNSIVNFSENKIELCRGYESLYQYISKYTKVNPRHKIITIGGDHSISTGTIAAMNEKYMKQYGDICTSDLMVLWIDCFPDLYDFDTSKLKDLNEMSAASLLGLCESHFVKNKLVLDPKQLIYYGLDDHHDNLDLVKELRIPHYTNKKIKVLDTDDTISSLQSLIQNKPLHISLDMKVFDNTIVKSVIPENKNGLDLDKIIKVIGAFKNNIVSMDIVEFNPMIGSKNDVDISKNIIKTLLQKTFDIKEKTINIFTEDTQFLIYRPISQENYDSDIGWYILRGLDFNEKNKLIESIADDTIITLDIEDENKETETYLITKTTINEQNEKIYYRVNTIEDCALFPQEKTHMYFELIN